MSAGKMLHTGNFDNIQTLKNYRKHCLWLWSIRIHV